MFRPRLLGIHRWLGLLLAPFLLMQVLTGAFLVASDLSPASSPALSSASAVTLVRQAEAAHPGYRVTRFYLPDRGHKAFADLTDAKGAAAYVEIDPSDPAAIRSGPLWHFPYRAAVQLHYRLMDGKAGMAVVLGTGIALTVIVLCGFMHWWPGLRRLRHALMPRGNLPSRQRLRHWHRSMGAMAALLALFSAVTGIMLMIPDILAAPGSAPPAAFARADPAQVEAALQAAQARFPAAAMRDVRFPPADRLDINFFAPERNPRAVHVVSVRLSDAAVVKSIQAQANPVLWMKVLPFHTGQILGLPGAMLLLLEAATLVFLVWAGIKMWLDKRESS